ncbi:MAG TPA: hypothetical protein VFZ73_10775 [Gemmatimonadaceae bacterium]
MSATVAPELTPTTLPAIPDVRHRVERLTPLLLTFGVFLAAVMSITPWPVGAYEDDAIYTLLAKSLATGEGYRMINLPGAPHATHYPPGYPLFLSLLWRIWPAFPDNVVVFKFANAVLLAAAAGGVYWFARRRLDCGVATSSVIAILGIASLPMLQLAGLVLSEPAFVALLFLSVPFVERSAKTGHARDAAVAGALLGALTMVRSIGIVAIGASVLVLLLRRHLRAAFTVAGAAALFLVPWQLWVSAHQAELPSILTGKYGPYGPWLADGYRSGGLDFARSVVMQNLASIGNTLSYFVMPAPLWWARLVALVILAGLLAAGIAVLARRSAFLALFLPLYLALIIAWPFDPYRFLLPLWPVVVITAGAAVYALSCWRPADVTRRGLRWFALGGVACLVAGHLAYNWIGLRGRSWTDLQMRAGVSARPLLEWVMRNTNEGDVLSTEHDVLVYLYTGRRGVPTSTFLPSQRVRPFSPADNMQWVGTMVRTFEPRFLVTGWPPHIAAADSLTTGTSPLLHRVGSIPNHTIFERVSR